MSLDNLRLKIRTVIAVARMVLAVTVCMVLLCLSLRSFRLAEVNAVLAAIQLGVLLSLRELVRRIERVI